MAHLSFPAVDRQAFIRALERGAVALTPNRRLARGLKYAFDRAQRERGRFAWPTAEILPWDAWLERSHVRAISGTGPVLITPLQEQVLWEAVVTASEAATELIQPAAAAALAREAWTIAHHWRLLEALRGEPLNGDGRAFRDWSSAYVARLRELEAIDAAQLPRQIAQSLRLGLMEAPAEIILCGFRELAPAFQGVLQACSECGTRVSELADSSDPGRAVRIELPSTRDEIAAAACWARTRLDANPHARIGIVLHDLGRIRDQVARALRDVMQPDALLPDAAPSTQPFNISLGAPLASYSLAHAALSAIELARGRAHMLTWSVLLRSPYLAHAEAERDGRACLDARLRQLGEVELDLATVHRYTRDDARCRLFAARIASLRDLIGTRMTGRRSPSRWVEALFRILHVLGFPGERTLSSDEHQTWQRMKDLLATFATLDGIAPVLDPEAALSRTRGVLHETVFQPESPEVPVQVLGVLEAAGLVFDHLWIAGLTDECWPAAPRPNPLLPLPLQRRAGVPHASADQELRFATALTEGFLRAAPEVVFSHARAEDDRRLTPSPLLARLPVSNLEDLGITRYRSLVRTVASARRIEDIVDTRVPSLPAGIAFDGGTAVFRDEAACPFRAYARHRVGATCIEVPQPGLDAMARGVLLHDVLAAVWRQLKTRAALAALDANARAGVVESAAAAAVDALARRRRGTLAGRFADIERQRLARLVMAWLDLELDRGEFEVELVEHKHPVVLGGLAIHARLDRMDRLPDGRRIVIDYKTGLTRVASWLGPRPEEPQLPLYCVASADPVVALAFAQVRVGETGFRGLAREADLLPGVKALRETKDAASYRDWDALTAAWREELERLGAAFLAGDAMVNPKSPRHTCKYCEVKPFCRVSERIEAAPIDDLEVDSDE